jgi:hypothetical protein
MQLKESTVAAKINSRIIPLEQSPSKKVQSQQQSTLISYYPNAVESFLISQNLFSEEISSFYAT